MNITKRAITSVYRQPIKSTLFLVLILLLSMLMSGAIAVRGGIVNTDQNLRRQMPAVATIMYNFDYESAQQIYEDTGEWPQSDLEFITIDLLQTIGGFPQVKFFDYSIGVVRGVTAPGLNAWQIPEYYINSEDPELGVELRMSGVTSVDFFEIRSRFMSLIGGRGFIEADFFDGQDVFSALIASGFATANDLAVGDYFDIQVTIFEWVEIPGGYREDRDLPPVFTESFSLQIVGIFDPILPNDDSEADLEWMRFHQESEVQHRIYVPIDLTERIFHIQAQEPTDHTDLYFQNIYLLNDPLDFADFAREVEALPGNWHAVDYSQGFSDISASMIYLQEIADFILIMAAGATLLISSLLVLLFLYDRKHEIGIYLALGEAKKKIIFQILLELLPLAFIGMTIALLAGNVLANNLSREMLRQDMAQPPSANVIEVGHMLEAAGYRFELTPEEMLEAFEIQFEVRTILIFYTLGLGVILISISLPVIRIIMMDPKKVLM